MPGGVTYRISEVDVCAHRAVVELLRRPEVVGQRCTGLLVVLPLVQLTEGIQLQRHAHQVS